MPWSRRIAVFSATLAGICSLAALAGWQLDNAALRGFGSGNLPLWPISAVGYLLLSAGFLALLVDRGPLAMVLWLGPLLIALLSIVQNSFYLDLGIDRLLYPDLLASYPIPTAGRPGANTIGILLMLSLAGYGAQAQRHLGDAVGGLVTTVTLALASTVAILLLFSVPGQPNARIFSITVPAAVAAALLTFGFIAMHSNLGWVRLLAMQSSHRRTLRLLIPAAFLVPLVPSMVQVLVLQRHMLSAVPTATIVAMLNVLMVALIGYWAVTRVAREHAASDALNAALDHTTVALTTPDGLVEYWSRGCERLYGWNASEACGKDKYALLRSWSPLPRVTDDPRDLVLVERGKDGGEITVIERGRDVASAGRTPVRILEISDISQRLAALAALKRSEERLALAMEAHEVGVFEWDVSSGRLEWSPGTEQRLGLVPGSILSIDSWREHVVPEDADQVFDTIRAAVDTRADRFSFRYRFREPAGKTRAVEGSAQAFYDAQGNLIRTVGVMLDVTEREERETELMRREGQLRSVLETVPDPMVVVDAEARIVQFSAAAERLWGFRTDQVLGRPATMLVPEEQHPAHLAVLERLLESDETLVGRVYRGNGLTASGRLFPMELRAGMSGVDGGKLLTMFVRDVSEQLAAQERLSELNAEIAHVSRQSAMSEVAADLAHELNQPLSATSNFLAAARLLLARDDPAQASDMMRQAIEQTQRAGEIIRRLRAFMAKGEVEMRIESLERTLRDAVELVLVGTIQYQTRVSFHVDPSAPMIFADRIQVQQVLVNLLRNSIEALRTFSSDDRHISISSHRLSEEYVEVAVADNGPGIPSHVLERMFSRFTSTKGTGAGMGIGLSISKRIIEAHGGTIRAENKPGGGACFRFTLPIIEEGTET